LNRIVSYGFIFLTIVLFILEGDRTHHVQVLTGLALSIIVAYTAFFLRWITLDATLPVIVLGTIILGFGGWWLAYAIIFFFISSSYLTHLNKYHALEPSKDDAFKDPAIRRDGIQVWANGFWVIIFTLLWFLTQNEAFLIGAFAVIATATADTWATEVGTKNPGVTRNILTREIVKSGTDGGVSHNGTMASLVGAIIISLFTLGFGLETHIIFPILIVSLAGFSGCVIDSYIGAIYQSEKTVPPKGGRKKISDNFPKNSIVNWLSTGIGGTIAFLLYSIF